MATINEIQDEIIDEFSGFDDWMDKYQLLIDLGNEQEPLDEKYKVESNLIDGCQSRVAVRSHTPGDTGCRPVLHRTDRTEGAPLAHPLKRSAGNGETDARLCVSV